MSDAGSGLIAGSLAIQAHERVVFGIARRNPRPIARPAQVKRIPELARYAR